MEVSRTRHFGRAADNLNLTQSAVSARVRQLEEFLGCRLFSRDRHNIRLTSAGKQLLPHAATMVAAWGRARQDVALADRAGSFLAVGIPPSVWDAYFFPRVRDVRNAAPDTLFSFEVHGSDVLLPRLLDGILDLVFLFEAPRVESLVVREMGHVSLVLVSSDDTRKTREIIDDGVIQVDWGASFARDFARSFPGAAPPALRTNLGGAARDLLKTFGGAAYLPRDMVKEDLESGALTVVRDAPVFDRVVFAAYADLEQRERNETLLAAFAR